MGTGGRSRKPAYVLKQERTDILQRRRAYVEQVLVPSLAHSGVVIADNLPAHRAAGVRDATEAADVSLLYLPPSIPDFKPIENTFAKLKALRRARAERTISALWNAASPSSSSSLPPNALTTSGQRDMNPI